MALIFNKKAETSGTPVNTPDVDGDERKKLFALIEEHSKKVKDMVGSRGRCKDLPFVQDATYVFHEDNDYYYFDGDINVNAYEFKYGNGSIEDMKQIVKNRQLAFEKSKYSCVLEKSDLMSRSEEDKVGEYTLELDAIKVQFKDNSTGKQFLFCFNNNPSNIGVMGSFFKELGVKNYFNIVDVPSEIFTVRVNKGDGFLPDNAEYVVFRDHQKLVLLRQVRSFVGGQGKVMISEIDVSEIKYYKQEGSLRYEQSISGEGGGSTSYGGAIVGGLLFGVTGALIGSRANEKPISVSSTTITHDTRILVLCISRNNITYQLSFELNAEDVFEWIIPEKQYDYVISKRREYYESME